MGFSSGFEVLSCMFVNLFTETANELYVQPNISLIPGSLVTFPNVLFLYSTWL